MSAIISIHALREEGDRYAISRAWRDDDFYPRPPRGGRLVRAIPAALSFPISIHALREEGDNGHPVIRNYIKNFYPRPPRGGRPRAVGRIERG